MGFPLRLCAFMLALAALAVNRPLVAATVVVNDPSDTLHSPGCATTGNGTCTLRDAMTFADENPGADAIHFGIQGAGVHPINLDSQLPGVTDPAGVTIDGYTQPGASANTLERGNDDPDHGVAADQGGAGTGACGLHQHARCRSARRTDAGRDRVNGR